MPQIVRCRCGQQFSAEANLYGHTLPCPYCQSPLTVPMPTASAAAQVPQASAAHTPVVPSGLTSCPSCRKPVTDLDQSCPHCWYALERHRVELRCGGRHVERPSSASKEDAATAKKRDFAVQMLAGAMQSTRDEDQRDSAKYGGPGMWILVAGFAICFVLVIVYAVSAPSRRLSGFALLLMGGVSIFGGIAGTIATFRESGNLGWAGSYLARRGAAILLGLGAALAMGGWAMIAKP